MLREPLVDLVGDRDGVAAATACGCRRRPRAAVEVRDRCASVLGAVLDARDVARACTGAPFDAGDDQPRQLVDRAELGVGLHRVLDRGCSRPGRPGSSTCSRLQRASARRSRRARARAAPRRRARCGSLRSRRPKITHRATPGIVSSRGFTWRRTYSLASTDRAVRVDRDPQDRLVAEVDLVDDRRLDVLRAARSARARPCRARPGPRCRCRVPSSNSTRDHAAP